MIEEVIKETEGQREDIEISGSFEGIPYKGKPINLKKTDDISQVLKLNRVMHVKRFALKDETELKAYEGVCQEIQDGHSQLSFEEKEYVPEDQNWVVLVRWIEWWYSPAGETKK